MAIAPRRDPSKAPVNTTAKVWAVKGTAPNGITICADSAVSRLNPITSPTCLTKSSGASATPSSVSFFAIDAFINIGVRRLDGALRFFTGHTCRELTKRRQAAALHNYGFTHSTGQGALRIMNSAVSVKLG